MRALFVPLAAALSAGCASLPTARAAGGAKCARLELGDAVRILAVYELTHAPIADVSISETETYRVLGTTSKAHREILLNSAEPDESVRRMTVIHELLHVRQWDEKLPADEETVRVCTARAYRAMYGSDQGLPEMFREETLLRGGTQ